MTARATTALRVMMLVVVAVVALANAIGWVDPDLWIPFVCIIAVMGIGTRGGVLDSLAFVLTELAVVLVLGVATFSGSRDFVWAASVGVSVLAVGKIALLEMSRSESARTARSRGPSSPATSTTTGEHSIVRTRRPDDPEPEAEEAPSQPLGTVPGDEARAPRAEVSGAVSAAEAPANEAPAEKRRKKRERHDQTPIRRAGGPDR